MFREDLEKMRLRNRREGYCVYEENAMMNALHTTAIFPTAAKISDQIPEMKSTNQSALFGSRDR